MKNYKVKVNNESESKEVQELFFALGATHSDNTKEYFKVPKKYPFNIGNTDGCVCFGGHIYGKELTIQQLRDMVVLKRNNVSDTTQQQTENHETQLYLDPTQNYAEIEWDGSFLLKDEWIKVPGGADFAHMDSTGLYFTKEMDVDIPVVWQRSQDNELPFIDSEPKNAWDSQVGGNHYKDMKIQPAQFAMENNLDYLQGNAIKYICRHKSKNGKEDLEKAKHYIELMIEHFYK